MDGSLIIVLLFIIVFIVGMISSIALAMTSTQALDTTTCAHFFVYSLLFIAAPVFFLRGILLITPMLNDYTMQYLHRRADNYTYILGMSFLMITSIIFLLFFDIDNYACTWSFGISVMIVLYMSSWFRLQQYLTGKNNSLSSLYTSCLDVTIASIMIIPGIIGLQSSRLSV